MGGSVSAGQNNEELVHNLIKANYIKNHLVERIFYCVDRGDYYSTDHRDSAYRDTAWKLKNIHISAPCIYGEVLEHLNLKEGHSFLNMGSGTGYLSTLAGLIIGSSGVNHGIEYHSDVVEYALDRLEYFKQHGVEFDRFELCEPQFVKGNCLMLRGLDRKYDRIYCGAACDISKESYIRSILKINGVLIMPLNDSLVRIERISEESFSRTDILPVSFASLIQPEKNDDFVDLPPYKLNSLKELCRFRIRKCIRTRILLSKPDIHLKKQPRPNPNDARTEKRLEPRSPLWTSFPEDDDQDIDNNGTHVTLHEFLMQSIAESNTEFVSDVTQNDDITRLSSLSSSSASSQDDNIPPQQRLWHKSTHAESSIIQNGLAHEDIGESGRQKRSKVTSNAIPIEKETVNRSSESSGLGASSSTSGISISLDEIDEAHGMKLENSSTTVKEISSDDESDSAIETDENSTCKEYLDYVKPSLEVSDNKKRKLQQVKPSEFSIEMKKLIKQLPLPFILQNYLLFFR